MDWTNGVLRICDLLRSPAGQVMQHVRNFPLFFGRILKIQDYDCWRNGIETQEFVPLGSAEP